MVQFDLPLDELRAYRGSSAEPADFDAFWQHTLKEARQYPLDARFEPVDTGLTTVDVYDATFSGFGGHPVRGWLTLPAGTSTPVPLVVQFVGYGGDRGLPHMHLLWPATGRAHFVMDTRGQGARMAGGDTPDPVGSGPSYPGCMTRGIESPHDYYYRRVFTDAVRAVEAARSHPLTDASRTTLAGGSQGAGIALAASGLIPDLGATLADVPFLCDFPRALAVTHSTPYREIADYLRVHRTRVAQVRATLSYFDGVHFAARAQAPALFSTALEDQVSPPSTVFAAFNAWPHPDKEINVYEFNGHEGGGPHQEAAALRWLRGRG
ncbi:acetylxylan esterase [Streptomyces sp. NPDC051913]|uniref:acetylxylan esterase n=1 Tax=Streptomyces sp. NPDC051913 TaxID=3365676 RepID=UPI0037D401AF